jgi:hypothetical protein
MEQWGPVLALDPASVQVTNPLLASQQHIRTHHGCWPCEQGMGEETAQDETGVPGQGRDGRLDVERRGASEGRVRDTIRHAATEPQGMGGQSNTVTVISKLLSLSRQLILRGTDGSKVDDHIKSTPQKLFEPFWGEVRFRQSPPNRKASQRQPESQVVLDVLAARYWVVAWWWCWWWPATVGVCRLSEKLRTGWNCDQIQRFAEGRISNGESEPLLSPVGGHVASRRPRCVKDSRCAGASVSLCGGIQDCRNVC